MISKFRTVVWSPSPGLDGLAWPDRYEGSQLAYTLDMSAFLTDVGQVSISNAVATAVPNDLLVGSPVISNGLVTIEIGGGSPGPYQVTFSLLLSNSEVDQEVVNILTLPSDVAALAGMTPPLTAAAWEAFFLTFPTAPPGTGRLWLNGGFPCLTTGTPAPWPPIPPEQIAWTAFLLTLPAALPAAGRLWLNGGFPEVAGGTLANGTILSAPEAAWLAFFATLPDTLPAQANQLYLNGGRPCLS